MASKWGLICLERNFFAVLKSCRTVNHLKQIQSQIISQGVDLGSQYLIPTLLSRCFVFSQISYAHKVFDRITDRNALVYDAMFKGYLQTDMFQGVLLLFQSMRSEDIQPTCYTIPMVLKPCAKLKTVRECQEVHSLVVKLGFELDTFVGSALIDVYSSVERVGSAYRVFSEMVFRDVVMWTNMINGFLTNGDLVSARKLFELAPERDVVLWNSMVMGYVNCGDMEGAKEVFEAMPKKDLMAWNTLLIGFSNNGCVEACVELFEEMPQRDIYSWNGLIGGYAHNECFAETLNAFKRMLEESDVKPNDFTIVKALHACEKLSMAESGKWIHAYADSRGYKDSVYVSNALIEFYAKCGMIEDAVNVFKNMVRRDFISWNSIINGLAAHGHGADALKLFDEMKDSGEKPDRVTYVGVLSACVHMGSVNDGLTYFKSMIDEHGIMPQMEHYGCIVDLLGRAGYLQQAVDFIDEMPLKANAAIWTALLGSCRVHRNLKFADLALGKLIEIEPENPSHYVMMGNIYKEAKRWEDSTWLKVAEKCSGSMKTPGCSSIQMDHTENR